MSHKVNYPVFFLFFLLTSSVSSLASIGMRNCDVVQGKKDFPWEISNGCGETYLTDIFYAEAIQNEQIAPLTIQDKHNQNKRIQIDRLIYPTIGNPNLYSKNNPQDTLMLVLRTEELADVKWENFQHPHSTQKKRRATSNDKVPTFYLVDRSQRSALTNSKPMKPGKDIHKIEPSIFLVHSQSQYPEVFRHRYTYEAHFDEKVMKGIEPGMYDIRVDMPSGVFEYQYNAVSVIEKESENYSVINVTDSQVSISLKASKALQEKTFKIVSHDKLKQFVEYINYVMENPDKAKSEADQKIRNAPFITFNGDLHNGGSPGSLLPADVMYTYQKEAEAIMNILMELRKPIFLVAGNHDGYVSMGHVPALVSAYAKLSPNHKSLDELVQEEEKLQGRTGLYSRYKKFISETEETLGGKHVDIFTGVFVRTTAQSFKEAYAYLEEDKRNLPLYDGFYYWRKTYGPLHTSWSYGKNHYINMNSYDCRQHRRSGWGMYTVNYGGCISLEQNLWISREINATNKQNLDIVLIAHHDPRGGHKGKDFPFYFKQLEYTGAGLSLKNYIQGEIIMAKYCKLSEESTRSKTANLGCLHDGLQEWMLPDKEFDCHSRYKFKEGENAGKCNQENFDYASNGEEKHRAWYSGYALIDKLARNKNLRTLLLGHTHYNSIETLLPGDELVPGSVILSKEDHKKFAEKNAGKEQSIPMRALSRLKELFGSDTQEEEKSSEEDKALLVRNGIQEEITEHLEATKLVFSDSGHSFRRILDDHELLVLRLTSVARMSEQKTKDDKEMFGFTLFDVDMEGNVKGYEKPQINGVTYMRNSSETNTVNFKDVDTIRIDRNERLKPDSL